MFRPFRRVLPLLITVISISLFSCAGKQKVIHILTDRKELAAAVEIYDAAHEELVITMHHAETIDGPTLDREQPDLVIGTHLESPEIIDRMKAVKWNYSGYSEISLPVDSRGRSELLPISFQLPLVIGRKSTIETLPDPSTVRPEELQAAASALVETDGDGNLTVVGFSPSWNPGVYVDLMFARDSAILDGGIEQVDAERLEAVVAEAGTWLHSAVGGSAPDAAFTKKYRYAPDIRLLEDYRIFFIRSDMAAWAALPDATSGELDFRYFRGDRDIPVSAVVSAALPGGSEHRSETMAFLEWLVEPGTQERLMDRWERDGVVVFGFFGGLSADPEVNRGALLERFPVLEGRIPEAHYLDAAMPLPYRWGRIREEVMAPWLADAASRYADSLEGMEVAEGPTLVEFYRNWDLSSLSETD